MKYSAATMNNMEAASKSVSQRTVGRKGRAKSKNYSNFIYRVLKQGHQEQSVCLSKDQMPPTASEAARLSLYNKRRTITRREIESAVKHVVAGAKSPQPL